MKVKNVHIKNFKRFTDLIIEEIPETAKMVVLVGPNGCGKTSVFEAFNSFYKALNSSNNQNIVEKDHNDYIYNHRFWNAQILCGAGHFKDESQVNYCKRYQLGNHENRVYINTYNDWAHFIQAQQDSLFKYSMYFRTAYRNDPDFSLSKLENSEQDHSITFIDNDQRVMRNYQKILLKTIDDLYLEENNHKTVADLRNELIGKLQQSMQNIFGDLILNNIQSPLKEGSFYFKKGIVENYHYKNLSSGEKAVFDLLLDLIVNLEDYQDSLFFIDEPEAHIHTKLQGQVVEEIYNLIPENSQLWITTHSLGVMTKAKELASKNPNSVVFLNFDGHDFDDKVEISPSPINQVVCQKFLSVALDGLEEKLAPEIIVLCEGSLEGKESYYNFDAEIYNAIFNEKYPYLTFISRGCKSELKSDDDKAYLILSLVYQAQSKVYRLVDRDDSSDDEVENLRKRGIFTTSQRNIEGYLLHNDLIKILVKNMGKEDLVDQALEITKTALAQNLTKDKPKPSDDLKSAAREIRVGLKNLLGLTRCGEQTSAFMKNTMLPLITPETEIYQEMEREIILPILKASGH